MLTRMDTLMGGGNNPDAITTYAEAIRELWPSMTTQDFSDAMKWGLRKVRWYGKLNVMAIAEFIREFQDRSRTMTKQEAKEIIRELRDKHGKDFQMHHVPADVQAVHLRP